jgi:membrane protein involved in colicin uptake
MLVTAAAVLFALTQVQTAHTAEKKATAARGRATAALEAKTLADEATKEARAAAAKAVADAQEAAEIAIQKAIADRDRILAERAADMRQQIEQAKADAQAQIKAIQDKDDGAPNGASPAEPDQVTNAQQHRQTGSAAVRPDHLTGRGNSKMTSQLIDKAQRMYDSGRYTVAEIAQSCGVSPTTIYRHIDTGETPTH